MLEPRKSLADTAYRLTYAHHVIGNEADEVESAITEEDPGHPNIDVLSQIYILLSTAQAHLEAATKLMGVTMEKQA